MSELFPPTIDEQIQCVKRELTYRRSVYGRLVFAKKMTRTKADREIETMQAVLETLEREKERGTGSGSTGSAA